MKSQFRFKSVRKNQKKTEWRGVDLSRSQRDIYTRNEKEENESEARGE